MSRPCQLCLPWNLPLTVTAHRTALGTVVPLSFQDSLWYHFHVVIHQAGNWAGEIETYQQELLDKPAERPYT